MVSERTTLPKEEDRSTDTGELFRESFKEPFVQLALVVLVFVLLLQLAA